MKCIHCGTDARLKDRADGRCPQCKHRFAFEPTKDPNKVTDPQFKAAVERVSGDGKVLFTERQLWYEFNRKWMRPGFWRSPYGWLPPLSGAGAVGLGALGVLKLAIFPLAAVGVAAGLGAGALLSHRANQRAPLAARAPKVSLAEFRKTYLARYTSVHGDIPGLLAPPEEGAAARPVPPELMAFSFDRAVVTDHAETAAMLVANRFHFEHNCAVLSRDGFPHGSADQVKQMLRQNPQLTVFALHDASPGGCLLPLTLRDPEWFPDSSVRIVDVGLRPETARRLKLPSLPLGSPALPPRLSEVLPAADAAWLAAGNGAELASLRPEALMRALYGALAAVGLPGEPAYDEALAVAGMAGVIYVADVPRYRQQPTDGGGTATTDGFG